MTVEVWTDNASGTLSGPASSGAGEIGVSTSTGTFPTPTSGEAFHVSINFGTDTAELAKVTGVSGTTFTLSAVLLHDHLTGEPVAAVITAEGLDSIVANAIALDTITTAGDLLAGTGSATVERLAVGTSGQVLTVGGADPSGLEWSTPSTDAASIDGVTVTGTPSAGQVILATGTSAAVWGSVSPPNRTVDSPSVTLGSAFSNPNPYDSTLVLVLASTAGDSVTAAINVGAGVTTVGVIPIPAGGTAYVAQPFPVGSALTFTAGGDATLTSATLY